MTKKITTILTGIFLILLGTTNISQAHVNKQTLTAKQKAIIPIAAFTAKGYLDKLKTSLNEGLDKGLTINEIKEVLVQIYAYCGFPRSLNGITTFMNVLEERKQQGIKDEVGKEASLLPTDKSRLELGTQIQTFLVGAPVGGATMEFAPAIDLFLKDHLFGDIFGRDNLDYESREIATLAALTTIKGAEEQLQSHFNISMNIGLKAQQLEEFIVVLQNTVGQPEATTAKTVLTNVLNK